MSLMDDLKKIGQLGAYGDIVFTVNPLEIMSFQKATRKRGVDWAKHEIIGEKPKLEATTDRLDEVTIDILLSSWFGVNPSEIEDKFYRYMSERTVKKLIIGNGLQAANVWGDFVINDISETYEEVDHFGQITKIGLSVQFLEYN